MPLPVFSRSRGGDEPLAEDAKTEFKQGESQAMAKTSPSQFFNQVKAEASKIYWPTRQETVTTAIFVAILMVLLAVFFLGIDSLFGAVVRWLLSLA